MKSLNSSSASKRSSTRRKSRNNVPQCICALLVVIPFMIVIGILISSNLIRVSLKDNVPRVRSVYSFVADTRSLKNKILDWLPSIYLSNIIKRKSSPPGPDWNKKFWTPISIQMGPDPVVTLCKLDFKSYSTSPHLYPMFKFLVEKSFCTGINLKFKKLSQLKAEISTHHQEHNNSTYQDPSGFVFHESRVGSTLVANMLASDPWNMVLSESDPPASVLLKCMGCSRERQVELFRDVVLVMGHSPYHKRYFLKFQSATTAQMSIALEAFPTVPWIFLYRDGVQTMMSHLDPLKEVRGAPCLRSMRKPTPEITRVLTKFKDLDGAKGNEAWCAAHLNMLCTFALAAFDQFGFTYISPQQPSSPSDELAAPTALSEGVALKESVDQTTQSSYVKRLRGMVVNYESLPGIFPNLILPELFDIPVSQSWLDAMNRESSLYSKGGRPRQKGGVFRHAEEVFTEDSTDKESRATGTMQNWADKILGPSYSLLQKASARAIQYMSPSLINEIVIPGSVSEFQDLNWKKLAVFPTASLPSRSERDPRNQIPVVSHRSTQDIVSELLVSDFTPWNPFSTNHSSQPYQRVDCPAVPDENYPEAYPVMDLINNWNPDDTNIPPMHYDSLCHFDYQTEFEKAVAYRVAEKPFVVYNMPELNDVVKKWSDLDYLQSRLGNKQYRTEVSKTNHFMYFRYVRDAARRFRDKYGKAWHEPTEVSHYTFEQFVKAAVVGQNRTLQSRNHVYFRVTAETQHGENKWLFDELPFFRPVKNQLTMVEPSEQRGIHCRFGMRAVIAEPHYDGSRNAVAMVGGLRRWIMAHPNQCKYIYLLPKEHPSGRHSEVDWSNPDLKKFPNFVYAHANEVILKPGDLLYVPTAWFHYIVSLNLNYQCNTRSGKTPTYDKYVHACGF